MINDAPTVSAMRRPLTVEVLEGKIAHAGATGAAGHRELAAQLQSYADEPHEDDELSPANLLVGVGEQLSLAGDQEAALDAYQRAVAAGTPTSPDARAFVVRALLDLGRRAEAEQLSELVRRSRPPTSETYLFMGEAWEVAGELDQANRWLTRGALLAQEQQARSEWVMLVLGRLRVRRALGFPPDDFDEAAAAVMAESRARLAQRLADRAEHASGHRPSPQAVLSREGDQAVIDLF